MQWKPVLVLSSAAVLLLVSAGTLRSQFSARVDLVVVPVSIRDNNGFLVTSLGRDDFKILEDGKPQTITNFSTDAVPLSAAIVVDDAISGAALKRLIQALPSLTAAFAPDDQMTAFRYDHFVWRLSEFTSDQAQIVKSFHELDRIADTRRDPEEPPAAIARLERKTPGWIHALARIFTVGSNGAPDPTAPVAPAPRTPPSSRTMHSAVYDAAMALQNRPENHRKVIFLISDGAVREPQISLIPGKTLHSFDRNVELLLKSGIQVYSVYTVADLLESSSGMLDAYAKATGGDVYGGRSASDMEFAVRRIVEQARTQYVLGYLSSNEAPRLGVYRKIEVKSGDPDQKRKVVHRKGYFQYPIPR